MAVPWCSSPFPTKDVHDASEHAFHCVYDNCSDLHITLCFPTLDSFTTKDELGKAGPPLLTPGQMGESSESFSGPEDEAPREYQANDSDSDGPILYTDDDDDDDEEDEDDDGSGESKTISKRWRSKQCSES